MAEIEQMAALCMKDLDDDDIDDADLNDEDLLVTNMHLSLSRNHKISEYCLSTSFLHVLKHGCYLSVWLIFIYRQN